MPEASSLADGVLTRDSPAIESAGLSRATGAELRAFSCLLEAIVDLPTAEKSESVYERIAEELRALLRWDTFSVLLLDERERLAFRWSRGLGPDVQEWVFGPGQGLVGRVAAAATASFSSTAASTALSPAGSPAVSSAVSPAVSTAVSPQFAKTGLASDRDAGLLPGHGAELVVPLPGRQRLVGVLSLGRFRDGDRFTPCETSLLEMIGRHLGRAIESSCAHTITRRLARNLSLLQEAGRELTSILDRQQLLERIAEMLGRLIDYQLFCVLLWNEDRQRLEEVFARRDSPAPHTASSLRLGEGLCGAAAALRQSIRVGDVALDSRFVPCGDAAIRSALAVPLIYKDRLLGVLDVESHKFEAFSPEHEQMLATLGSSVAVALANAELYEQLRLDERLLAADLETARSVQRLLLPRSTPWIEGVQLGVCSAASRHLGGDLYDFFPYGPGRTALAIGDVAGKGTAAALYASLVLGILRGYVQQTRCSPACVLSYLHAELRQLDVERRFLAFSFAVYDQEKRTLSFANAGLPYPLLLRGGEVREIETSGLPLGALEDPRRDEIEIRLEPGDVVLLASDGLEECLDTNDRPFGSERLAKRLQAVAGGTAEEIASALLEATDRHLGERARASDDRTALVLKVTG